MGVTLFLRTRREVRLTAAGESLLHGATETHSLVGLVDAGLGVALLPASTRSALLDNLVYRGIEAPRRLRSDLYLARGPGGGGRQGPGLDRRGASPLRDTC